MLLFSALTHQKQYFWLPNFGSKDTLKRMPITNTRWDIFCKVIDHYGDIGVSWRLATQLAKEYSISVRLWVDRPKILAHICSCYQPNEANQTIAIKDSNHTIEVCAWPNNNQKIDQVADFVVAMFGCLLPGAYFDAMRLNPPIGWYNLEYLSAETWVDAYHGMDSIKPNISLKQRFFIPGFSEKSGGLLREKNLLAKRDNWQACPKNSQALFKKLDLPINDTPTLYASVFCYPTPALVSLLQAWTHHKTPITAFVPLTSAKSIKAWLGQPPKASLLLQKGSLTLKILPFVDQEDFTHLLWSCDLNIVRGEDSFVSALWAAKPFIWHIYPQRDATHLVKLNAFLDKYSHRLDKKAAAIWQSMQHNFNCHQPVGKLWPLFWSYQKTFLKHAKEWSHEQQKLDDLVTKLINDAQSKSDNQLPRFLI